MVGQRAIQLRVVCAFFCPLPFLAPLARSANARGQRCVRGQLVAWPEVGSRGDWAGRGFFCLLPVRLFEIASPEWRPLGWIHAASVATLTLLYLWCVGGKPWVRHFAFPVAFFFVAVPWPTAVEVPIIQGLMRTVANVAAETAMLLGIPAQVEGNLIRVSTGLVGVNEACSGIRSLQTSLMIGLLFGELKRLSVLRRITLVVGAVIIAVFANFIRAVFLVTVAATKNVSEVSRWHDVAGYTIIALVFFTTMGLAYLLGRAQGRRKKRRRRKSDCQWQACRLRENDCSRHGCLYRSPAPISPQRSAGSCLSRSGLLHGIAPMKPILSAAYAGPCNGRNKRQTFAN